jgi:hypothetical protein
MTSPEPSLDADRTVTQEHKPLPETIDVSRPEESTGQTGPSVAPALADAPSIPGDRVTANLARRCPMRPHDDPASLTTAERFRELAGILVAASCACVTALRSPLIPSP